MTKCVSKMFAYEYWDLWIHVLSMSYFITVCPVTVLLQALMVFLPFLVWLMSL